MLWVSMDDEGRRGGHIHVTDAYEWWLDHRALAMYVTQARGTYNAGIKLQIGQVGANGVSFKGEHRVVTEYSKSWL